MTSPSEPVESREQPRGWPIHWVNDQKLDDLHALWHDQSGNMMGERECGWEHCEFWIMAQFTLDIALPVELHHRLAERDATIRNLETLRDVHRRTIDDLISEAQTDAATIDELRAEVDAGERGLQRVAAILALPEMPWDRKHIDAAGGQGARGYNEALANVKAILEGE